VGNGQSRAARRAIAARARNAKSRARTVQGKTGNQNDYRVQLRAKTRPQHTESAAVRLDPLLIARLQVDDTVGADKDEVELVLAARAGGAVVHQRERAALLEGVRLGLCDLRVEALDDGLREVLLGRGVAVVAYLVKETVPLLVRRTAEAGRRQDDGQDVLLNAFWRSPLRCENASGRRFSSNASRA